MHDIGVGMVSSAAKQQKIQVLYTEFGAGILNICSFWLVVFLPLSPPSFTHTSVWGMMPLCQVRRPAL